MRTGEVVFIQHGLAVNAACSAYPLNGIGHAVICDEEIDSVCFGHIGGGAEAPPGASRLATPFLETPIPGLALLGTTRQYKHALCVLSPEF